MKNTARGRPLKAENPLSCMLPFRVEIADKELFKEAAKNSGLLLSEWLRDRVKWRAI